MVFDLDGTLVDSRHDIAAALDGALVSSGFSALGLERVTSFVGDGARILVERALAAAGAPATMADGVLAEFLDLYGGALLARTTLYPGVRETLDRVSAVGVALAVVSNKPFELSRSILEGLAVADRFRVVVGGDSLPTRKPDPAPILFAMGVCGATGASTVVVGDGETDIAAGRAAGAFTVGVTYGFRSAAQLEAAEADALVATMPDLVPALVRGGFALTPDGDGTDDQ